MTAANPQPRNTVPPGYKQTEVGVIPEDWEVTPLGQFVSLQRGHDLTAQERRSGTVPVMGGGGQNGTHSVARAHGPGVVLGRSGASFGEAYLCECDFWPHNTSLYVTDFHGNSIRFAFYLLDRTDFSHHNSGGAQQSLNRNFIARIPLAVPSTRAEQEAIAGALSDADGWIESLEKLIAKKRAIKQGAMQALLTPPGQPGHQRLPGFDGEWEVKRLGDVCSMRSGEGITSASIDETSPYPCYGGNGLRGYSDRFTHRGRYALIGRQGALCGNVVGVAGAFFASEHAVVVTPLQSTDIGWLTFVLGRMGLNQYSESSAQPGLSVSRILQLEVHAPPTRDEQSAIAAVLSDMDAEIEALEAKLVKARQIKQGMMQELLTGRIRLV